jgi:exodeoxyribonuclease-3
MTYNIENGGQDDLDNSRLDLVLQVVNDIDPDVLVLQEAMNFDAASNRKLRRFEQDIGLHGLLGKARTGQHVAVLVREYEAILESQVDVDNFYHAMVRVRLALQGGTTLTLLGTHLCPYSGQVRLAETRHLASHKHGGEPTLVLGDLNTPDHRTKDSRVRELAPEQRVRYLVPGNPDEVDRRAIEWLEASGLVDLHPMTGSGSQDNTVPTARARSEFTKMRLDYAFGTPDLVRRTRCCYVASASPSDIASDHYPLVADIEVDLRRRKSGELRGS